MSTTAAVTELMEAWHAGSPEALDRLLPVILADIRSMARRYLAGERPHHTYQPTDLVQEVYLRLVGERIQEFHSRRELFAFVARLMRQILIDHSRAKQRRKRGDGRAPVPLSDAGLVIGEEGFQAETVLAVDQALQRLGQLNERGRQVVELRYFVGLTVPEVACALDLGVATVERDWSLARRYLAKELA